MENNSTYQQDHINSNTTLVKVKCSIHYATYGTARIQIQHLLKLNSTQSRKKNYSHFIQIQHLLKLNVIALRIETKFFLIQIQHLLKLNGVTVNSVDLVADSNTTLVKVKC